MHASLCCCASVAFGTVYRAMRRRAITHDHRHHPSEGTHEEPDRQDEKVGGGDRPREACKSENKDVGRQTAHAEGGREGEIEVAGHGVGLHRLYALWVRGSGVCEGCVLVSGWSVLWCNG